MLIHADGSKCAGEDCRSEPHYTTTNPTPLQRATSTLTSLSDELHGIAQDSHGDRAVALKVSACLLFCSKYLIQQCLMSEPSRPQMMESVADCIDRVSLLTRKWQE